MFGLKTENRNRPPRREKTFATLFSSSTRLTLTYIVLFVWIALAIFAIFIKADLYALAVYFTSGLPVILGYLWARTARPASMHDAAEIVKGIGQRPGNNNQYGGYDQVGYNQYDQGGFNQGFDQYGQQPNQDSQIQISDVISIYADDASAELKINQSQLGTLTNIGYINNVGGKYTFKKNTLEQIKSLINGIQDPTI
jgi:hypothetical protein